MQNTIHSQIEQSYQAWLSVQTVPDDLTAWGFPALSKQNLTDTLSSFLVMVEQLDSEESFEPSPVSLGSLQSHLNSLRQYVVTHLVSNPQPHMSGYIVLLQTIEDILVKWVELADPKKNRISGKLVQQLAQAISKLSDAELVYKELLEKRDELANAAELSADSITKITNNESSIDDLLTEATTKSTAITAAEQTASSQAGHIKSLISSLKSLKEEVDIGLEKQHVLFEEFEGYKEVIDVTLGDANRVSMAGAFITRRDTYDAPLKLWTTLFFGSLVMLTLMAVWVLVPFFSLGTWRDSLIRLPLSAPAVWMAWFSAKQFGYITRLKEDYAYKAAAAMAFEGYKREARESGAEMQQRLLETAIEHLADNPIRIYSNKDNHVSPLNEILEKNIKDEGLMKSLTNLISAFKK